MKRKMLRFEGDLGRHQKKRACGRPTVENRVRGNQGQLHLRLVTLSREGAWGPEEKDVEMF